MKFTIAYKFPISGSNKIARFKKWAEEHAADIPVCLPLQAPIKTETLTVRLQSERDREALAEKLANAKL